MSALLDEIVSWDATVRAVVALSVGAVALVSIVLALVFSFRTGRDGAPTAIGLMNAGWRMNLHEVLDAWAVRDEKHKSLRHAARAVAFDLVGEAGAAGALLLSAASLRSASSVDVVHDLGEPIAWLILGGALAVVVGDLAQLMVMRKYRTTGKLWWLGSSLTVTAIVVRIPFLAAGALYVFAGSASLAATG